MSVVGFTGKRSGPTPQDIEEFRKDVDELAETLKADHVGGFALVWIDTSDGGHKLRSEWSKLPGTGLHELVGASALLQADLVDGMPRE